MGFYRAIHRHERSRRADYIEDVACAIGAAFDGGKAANSRIKQLRKG